ncbi:hypothetical protein PHYBOEH_002421 [Phytophthora boehmeriae]|uniref:Uncharacterized protein n=1 Tax=Phytophthora boehmeriae TaxID=109152 RepID=A0A8T1X587_9STRA|nr:hypothetical protein PHYBOEH_002421 [Phytophthora boehmeriae]
MPGETEVPDQLKSFISDEVSRQLRERGSILNAMKEQMAKVLEEFEDMAANVNSKRSWSNSVAKTKPSMSSPKKSSLGTSAAATSPPRLPKISDGILKNIHQFKQDASEETLPSNNVGHRSPNGKIVFGKHNTYLD